MICRVIRGISLHGSAVIVEHGANFVLRGTDAFRVQLVAPLEARMKALVDGAFGFEPRSPSEARAELDRAAEERRICAQRHFRADVFDPLAYDATFNLRRLDPECAAGLIASVYRKVACLTAG